MLITEATIQERFLEHLSWATEIDLATAWATSNAGLRALQRRSPSPKVRAIVGLWGNVTEPFALRKLAKLGQLRSADPSRRFHPKVFLFRGAGRSVAWIGSANFTSGGFGMNEEALFETSDTASVQNWFVDLWGQCDPLDASAISDYAKSRQMDPPPLPPRSRDAPNQTPLQLLEGVRDWRSFVSALEQCDGWWSNRRPWSVLGEHGSWRETVEVLHDVASQRDWSGLEDYDRRRLLGLTQEESWALLGRMRQSSLNTVFGSNREKIQDAVLAVTTANASDFPQVAFDSYEALWWNVDGVKEGIATRLLTLARPDRFVSLNNGSRVGLARCFGLRPSTLGHPRNYRRLLTKIYNQEWYSEPTPRSARERAVYWMRTALLDCFVYDDQQTQTP